MYKNAIFLIPFGIQIPIGPSRMGIPITSIHETAIAIPGKPIQSQSAYIGSMLKDVLLTLEKKNLRIDRGQLSVRLVDLVTLQQRSGQYNPNIRGLTIHHDAFMGERQDVLVLDGMSPLLSKSVLAHELGHVWIFQHHANQRITLQENEGFCELLSYYILKYDGSLEAQSNIIQMNESPDPIYGVGFRMMHERLHKMGWYKLLRYMVGA